MSEQTGRWRAEGGAAEVTYSLAAMESMRRAALEGLQRIPKRGLEVGGVLLGARDGGSVHVSDWRPIACEHARGPAFLLSEADEAGLRELLASIAADPQLAGLEPVGWMRTRTAGDITLSDEDLSLHNRLFPQPWQIVLVIRPHMYEPARAAFFLREPDGSMRTEAAGGEFELPHKSRRIPVGFDPSQPGPRPPRLSEPAVAVSDGASPALSEEPGSRRRPPSRLGWEPSGLGPVPGGEPSAEPRKWLTPIRLVPLALAAALAVFLGYPLLDPLPPESLSLGVRDFDGQLILTWNPAARVLRGVSAASLGVQDGRMRRAVPLTAGDLRSGSLTYQRLSSDVEFRLELRTIDGEPVTEIAKYVGQPGSATESAAAAGDAVSFAGASPPGHSDEGILAELDRLRSQLEEETRRTNNLRSNVDAEKKRLGIGPAPQP